MPELPPINVIWRQEVKDADKLWVNTANGRVIIPVTTLRSISGYLLATAMKESWEPSETIFLDDAGGC